MFAPLGNFHPDSLPDCNITPNSQRQSKENWNGMHNLWEVNVTEQEYRTLVRKISFFRFVDHVDGKGYIFDHNEHVSNRKAG